MQYSWYVLCVTLCSWCLVWLTARYFNFLPVLQAVLSQPDIHSLYAAITPRLELQAVHSNQSSIESEEQIKWTLNIILLHQLCRQMYLISWNWFIHSAFSSECCFLNDCTRVSKWYYYCCYVLGVSVIKCGRTLLELMCGNLCILILWSYTAWRESVAVCVDVCY